VASDFIEIRAILRDEVSRAVQQMGRSVKDFEKEISTKQSKAQVDALTNSVTRFRTEFSSAMRLIGASSLVGGGIVATLGLMTNALANFSRQGLNLHYTSQALGVTTQAMQQLTVAGRALGLSQEQAAAGVQSALGKLQDLKTFGPASEVFQALSAGAHGSGVILAREMQAAMTGPEGLVGGLKIALERAKKLVELGRPQDAKALLQALDIPFNFKDLGDVIGALHRRIDPNIPAMRAYSATWTNLEISMENIKDRIGMAVIPAFERLIGRFDEWVASDDVQRGIKSITDWIEEVNWDKVGQRIGAVFEGLKQVVNNFVWLFDAVNPIIKAMGFSWTGILTTLIAIKFASWLFNVAAGLAAVSKLGWLLRLVPALAIVAGAIFLRKQFGEQAETDITKKHPGRLEDMPGLTQEQKDNLKGFRGGNYIYGGKSDFNSRFGDWGDTPQKFTDSAGDGGGSFLFTPPTDEQNILGHAPLSENIEDRRGLTVKRELVDDFRELQEQLVILNDYFDSINATGGTTPHNMPMGGALGESNPILLPEGLGIPGGGSAFEALNYQRLGPAGGGKTNRPWPSLPPIATALPGAGSTYSGVTSGLGFASWYGNRPEHGFRDTMDKGSKGYTEAQQGIALSAIGGGGKGSFHYLTDPHTGLTHVAEQTDVGPNVRTQKLVDIHASQLLRMGYNKQTFPDAKGLWGVQPTGFENMHFLSGDIYSKGLGAGKLGQGPRGLSTREGQAGSFDDDGLTGSLAAAFGVGGRGMTADIEIDVGERAQREVDEDSLFRPVKLDQTQQMGNTSGTAGPYNDHYGD
jgi:hypothetical protein